VRFEFHAGHGLARGHVDAALTLRGALSTYAGFGFGGGGKAFALGSK